MFQIEKTIYKFLKFPKLNCTNCTALRKFSPKTQLRSYHITPISFAVRKFKGIENEYMFKFISKNGTENNFHPEQVDEVETVEQFEDILNQNYRKTSATEVLNAFKAVQNYCSFNQINLTDTRFDKLVDGLMDHCRDLKDHELLELLSVLKNFPRCESYREHNFHDVWSCLDDLSCERFSTRDTEFLFKLADAWYQLDLGRIGEYVFFFIDILVRRCQNLTKDQVVGGFFYLNVCRRKEVPFELEEAVQKYLDKFNVDELGVIALGYFKSQSKIKFQSIMLAMMKAVEKECSTINQITLSSILKVLRFSKSGPLSAELDHMLDVLSTQIDRLSAQCCLHIAIIGSGNLHYHKKSLDLATQKIVSRIENPNEVRLKDMERLLIASTMVDYRPEVTPDLFEAVYKEIHEERRTKELASFPRVLPCILWCFSMMNMYSYKLMDRILDKDYILNTYGKNPFSIGKDIYTLDCCIDVECPDYKGNRLLPQMKYKSSKWLIEFIPSHNQPKKFTVYDKLHLDVEENILHIVGKKEAIKVDYVAPHFGRADIILCKNLKTNEFVEPKGLDSFLRGDVKFTPKNDDLKWYAVSIIGWNNTIRNSSRPVGMITMKQRHLKKLGYNSRLVLWNQYIELSKENKIRYLEDLLR